MNSNEFAAVPPSPLQQAGLQGDPFHSNSIELKEITSATILRLHSLTSAETLAAALETQGLTLPLQTNQSTGSDPAALCLRPREWLLFSEHSEAEHLASQIRPAIDPDQTTLLNTSDGLATFRLSGPGAPWLLSKLSGLDFLGGSSGAGAVQHCARTRMAHAAVLVHYHRPGDGDLPFVFDLLFDRSLAKYLWELLSESAEHADDLANAFEGSS